MQITVQSTYASTRTADETLRTHLAEHRIPDEVASICELAMHELLTNLVDHAYQGDAGQQIVIEIQVTPTKIEIKTTDNGLPPGMDLSKATMPDPEELAESGYGLAIIHTLMDEVNYEFGKNQNTWKLVKRL